MVELGQDIVREREMDLLNRHLPFRFSVFSTHKVMGVGTIVQGNMLSGKVKPGDEVLILPNNKTTIVKSIEKYNKKTQEGKSSEV